MHGDVNLPSQEYLLVDYARRLDRHREGRRAVHVHLSRLRAQNRRDHHVRIAANTVEDYVKAHDGQLFVLVTGDLVYVVKHSTLPQLDDSVMKLRYLFSEDPLTQINDDEGGGHGKFAKIYNIETNYAAFLETCERLYKDDVARKKRLAEMEADTGGEQDHRKPLGPSQLSKLEDFLMRTDLTSVMRRQAVCAVAPDAPPRPIFNELYVSIGDLAKTVLPDVNLAANRWLFQHLTQTLDRRVLKLLARADDTAMQMSFSVNLNVETILAQEFIDFDESLRTGTRGTILVELQFIDTMADFRAFQFARDFCKERGYRVCLDGVTDITLPFVDRTRFGVDLIKLAWNNELSDMDTEQKAAQMKDMVGRAGRTRMILSRCDNDEAVRVGQSLGISMFQGRHLDFLLQDASRRNAPLPQRRTRSA